MVPRPNLGKTEASTTLTIRGSNELIQRLKKEAESKGIPVSSHVVALLSQRAVEPVHKYKKPAPQYIGEIRTLIDSVYKTTRKSSVMVNYLDVQQKLASLRELFLRHFGE